MKRKVLVLSMAMIIAGAVSVSAFAEDKPKSEEKAEQTSDTKEDKESKDASKKDSEKKDKKSKKSKKKDLKEIEIDKPYTVKTDEGSYSFTIHGAYRTDWDAEDGKEILVLSYEVENTDYEPENGSLLLLNANTFHMQDMDGNELEASDSTMSENGFPDFVDPGDKKEQEQPYVADEDTDKVKVIYENNGKETAEITLEVKDEAEKTEKE